MESPSGGFRPAGTGVGRFGAGRCGSGRPLPQVDQSAEPEANVDMLELESSDDADVTAAETAVVPDDFLGDDDLEFKPPSRRQHADDSATADPAQSSRHRRQ